MKYYINKTTGEVIATIDSVEDRIAIEVFFNMKYKRIMHYTPSYEDTKEWAACTKKVLTEEFINNKEITYFNSFENISAKSITKEELEEKWETLSDFLVKVQPIPNS